MTMTCEQFEARLSDYLEGDLHGDERDAFERHAESCLHCHPILNDIKAIVAGAGALGPIEPSRDIWSGIESRIGAAVVPIASRRSAKLIRGLAAAVVLIVATAGITYQLTVPGHPTAPSLATNQSSLTAAPAVVSTPAHVVAAVPESVAVSDVTPRLTRAAAIAPASAALPNVRAVRNSTRALNTAAVYDREVARLHAVIQTRRAELDPKTVAAIERSLAVIDTAIAQARGALAADPASRFLHGRLTDVLDKKVELLRTTAMLPTRS